MSEARPPSPLAHALVGRERERAMLRDALAAALAGRGALALISGEAGIGKTALAESLCQEAATAGALVLVGRCLDLSETPPYGPWAEIFAGLSRLPDQPPLPAPFGGGDPAPSQAALIAAARDALGTAATRRPLVLLLDDLHWADPASLDVLRALARQVAGLAALLLVTYRAEEVTSSQPLYQILPALVRESRALRLALRPLGLPQVAALVASRYPLAEAEAVRLVAYLDRRGEGNPFFVGEVRYALEESGLLLPPQPGASLWGLGDLGQARLSSLVHQVIDGRAARLGDEARGLLTVAAAIGQEVPLGLWATVAAADDAALLPAVEAALEARLLLASVLGRGSASRTRSSARRSTRASHPCAAGTCTSASVNGSWRAGFPHGRLNYWKSGLTKAIGDGAIAAIVEYAGAIPSPHTAIVFADCHGAYARVGNADTAYPHRDLQFDLVLLSSWVDPADTARNIRWTREFFDALRPHLADGVYVNDLGEEGGQRVRDAHGASGLMRVRGPQCGTSGKRGTAA